MKLPPDQGFLCQEHRASAAHGSAPQKLCAEEILARHRRRAGDGLGGEKGNQEAKHCLCGKGPCGDRAGPGTGQAGSGRAPPSRLASPLHIGLPLFTPPLLHFGKAQNHFFISSSQIWGWGTQRWGGACIQLTVTEKWSTLKKPLLRARSNGSEAFYLRGCREAELLERVAFSEEANRPLPSLP